VNGRVLLVLDEMRQQDEACRVLLQDDLRTCHGNLDRIAEVTAARGESSLMILSLSGRQSSMRAPQAVAISWNRGRNSSFRLRAGIFTDLSEASGDAS
jgi:hypothetical protein